eukprot:178515-Hanusia_phi.AAC.1
MGGWGGGRRQLEGRRKERSRKEGRRWTKALVTRSSAQPHLACHCLLVFPSLLHPSAICSSARHHVRRRVVAQGHVEGERSEAFSSPFSSSSLRLSGPIHPTDLSLSIKTYQGSLALLPPPSALST